MALSGNPHLSDHEADDKSSSSTFSEDQYDEKIDMVLHTERAESATPKITAMSSLKQAVSNMVEQSSFELIGNGTMIRNKNMGYPECDVVRAAIHYLGDLFCEFNDNISSISKNSKTSKNSSNLSYKEHENESIDNTKFVKFLEDKFSLYGYSEQEINQLFIDLKPRTPSLLSTSSPSKNKNHGYKKHNKPPPVNNIHFTEFNVVIHQFYTSQFKTMFVAKTSYQKEDVYQLLLHSIKAKLQVCTKKFRLMFVRCIAIENSYCNMYNIYINKRVFVGD